MSEPPPPTSGGPPPPSAPQPPPPPWPEPEPKPERLGALWSAGDALVGVALAIGIVIFGSIPVVLIAGDSGLDATIGSQIVLEGAFIGAAFFFAVRAAAGNWREAARRLGLHAPAAPWLKITFAGLGIYFAFAVVFSQLVADPEQVDVADELGFDQSTLGAISAALLIVLAAPLAEEVFFRGFFFGALRTRMSLPLAAALSGAFFGAIHLSTGNIAVAAQLAVLGIILAYLYDRVGSLWSPILLHGINNALAFTVLVST